MEPDLTGLLRTMGFDDAMAISLLLVAWLAVGWRIEHPGSTPSVSVLMARYRHAWMAQMVNRDQRIFDAAILQNLRDGTAFFASTCLIGIGGLLALVGNPAPLEQAAARLPGEVGSLGGDALIWQMKLLVPVLLLSVAFLRFVWANRLFGYFSVIIGSVPNAGMDPSAEPEARHRATQAAWINVRAAVNFNRGLRAIYFALAGLAWLLGAIPLILATLITLATLYSREFRSVSRAVLIEDAPPVPGPVTRRQTPKSP